MLVIEDSLLDEGISSALLAISMWSMNVRGDVPCETGGEELPGFSRGTYNMVFSLYHSLLEFKRQKKICNSFKMPVHLLLF